MKKNNRIKIKWFVVSWVVAMVSLWLPSLFMDAIPFHWSMVTTAIGMIINGVWVFLVAMFLFMEFKTYTLRQRWLLVGMGILLGINYLVCFQLL